MNKGYFLEIFFHCEYNLNDMKFSAARSLGDEGGYHDGYLEEHGYACILS